MLKPPYSSGGTIVRNGSNLSTIAALFLASYSLLAQPQATFTWPEHKRVAVSLSFDDGRASQVDVGTALLDKFGVKATFFVVPSAVGKRLEGWKKAVASGHEIGNHSLTHPCSGNFPWSRQNALEEYTLGMMRRELEESNRSIQSLLGTVPRVFAYPCGQTFIGRAEGTRSYIPLAAELFIASRGWRDEGPNDPAYCDLAKITGIEMDGKGFEEVRSILEKARETNSWVVLAGHEMGESGEQTTRLKMLRKLLEYVNDPANGVWIAPVGTVAGYILEKK